MERKRWLGRSLAAAAMVALWPGLAGAVEKVDFLLKDTRDLLDVCTVDDGDTFGREAAHFCVAYIEGAVDYHDAVTDRKNLKRLIC